MQLSGAVAVVTGAGGGIGAELAATLAERGARVALTDIDAQRVADVAARLAQRGGAVLALPGDAASEEALRALLAATSDQLGPVDLFVANAGVLKGAGLDASEADWALSLEVNVMAHVRAARLLVPGWRERGRGHFLSIASAAGLLTQVGSPTYSVSKHGAVAFAEWLAVTYGAEGIGVTCVCPMGVNTDMLARGKASADPQEVAATRAVLAAGAVVEPATVAAQALDAVEADGFLVLPHPEVAGYVAHKAANHESWIAGMQRLVAAVG